jgi:hypothetical protein
MYIKNLRKIILILLIIFLGASVYAQQGFFIAAGSGYGNNVFQLDKMPGNALDIHNYNTSSINSISVNLELGAMYFKYMGIGVFASYNIVQDNDIDIDSGNNNKDPITVFHAMVEAIKFNVPIGEYFSLGIDIGVGALYYSIGKNTKTPLSSLTSPGGGDYYYAPTDTGLQGITEGYMIGPAAKACINLHPAANGFFMSIGAEYCMDLGDVFGTYMGINGEDRRHNPFISNTYISIFFMAGFKFGYDDGWGEERAEAARWRTGEGRLIKRRP